MRGAAVGGARGRRKAAQDAVWRGGIPHDTAKSVRCVAGRERLGGQAACARGCAAVKVSVSRERANREAPEGVQRRRGTQCHGA